MKRLLIASVLFSNWLVANQNQYSSGYQQCIDNSGGVTVAIRTCEKRELKYQDALLNSNYKEAMGLLSTEQKKELKQAQRLWIKYRDKNCGLLFGLTGGSMDILNGDSCYVDMTARRAMELEEIIQLRGE